MNQQPLGVRQCLTEASRITHHISNLNEAPMIQRMLSTLASVSSTTPSNELEKLRLEIDIIMHSLPMVTSRKGYSLRTPLAQSSNEVARICRQAKVAVVGLLGRRH